MDDAKDIEVAEMKALLKRLIAERDASSVRRVRRPLSLRIKALRFLIAIREGRQPQG